MATPYENSLEQEQSQWQDPPPRNDRDSSNFRSVTPAMNNTRGVVRNGAASPAPNRSASPRPGGSAVEAHYNSRSGTPTRYPGVPNSSGQPPQSKDQPSAPSSTGLIRLTLRKPMGIVFEPMYDPNSPSVQRGVRICDLPRTGAAALSRKVEVGDELLSINDKTMSRLSFDEIMDFIIEADPEEVNLLFRRPRKEMLQARHGMKTPTANTSSAGVKWVDDEQRSKRKDKKKPTDSKKDKKPSRRSKREDDGEAESEDQEYRSRKTRRSRKHPYESESFLDILIDTICANPDNVCRDRPRPGEDDDYYSDEDDGTFASRDDSTYLTYESEEQSKKKKAASKSKSQNRDDDDDSTYQETEDDTIEDRDKRKKKREKEADRSSPPEESKRASSPEKKKKPHQKYEEEKPHQKYEDDGTLESVDDSVDRDKVAASEPEPVPVPLGLAPNPNPEPAGAGQATDTDDHTNPAAPIRDLEFDEHGADISVMESLGGPSLLIEKQRQATMATRDKEPLPDVPQEIIDNFGHDYPLDFGFTREQTIKNDPLRFYTHLVKALLQEHEPEKVRLLDKLLAKYKGREDHLVQKLSVRYMKEDENGDDEDNEQEEDDDNFDDAVKQGKNSAGANATIKAAKERMDYDGEGFEAGQWPDKETKEGDQEDNHVAGDDEEGSQSGSGSDYSGQSIDGTSPAVIAQVSELLNYVYGKTSVPGQIDRVSTIMRAYEGREAVLLELLETKALIKANREKENAGNLPSFLQNSANAQRSLEEEIEAHGDVPAVTPMATQPQVAASNDDLSSMSGVSSPAVDRQQTAAGVLKQISAHESAPSTQTTSTEKSDDHDKFGPAILESRSSPSHQSRKPTTTPDRADTKKKKKGLFGGLFGGKKGKKGKDASVGSGDRSGSTIRGMISPMSRKSKSAEASI